MYKKMPILMSLFLLSLTSFSQTVQEKLDKLAKDPKTAERAAKADVYIHDKKMISDSTQKNSQPLSQPKKKKKCTRRSDTK